MQVGALMTLPSIQSFRGLDLEAATTSMRYTKPILILRSANKSEGKGKSNVVSLKKDNVLIDKGLVRDLQKNCGMLFFT